MSQGREGGRGSRSGRSSRGREDQKRSRDKKSSGNFSRTHEDYPELTPTILLKNRVAEARSLSPASPAKSSRDPQQVPVKETTQETTQKLEKPVKLLNEELNFQDSVSDYLSDASDFLVVGCVGPQWTGKSSLLSHLALSSCGKFIKKTVFPLSDYGVQQKMETATVGLDLFISDDRVIWLDCQPLLSPAIAELRLSSTSTKEGFAGPDPTAIETSTEVQSLQLLSFLYCVCHVVVVVQDSLIDPNLLRLLQTAEMLKPNTSTADSPSSDNFPHLVFVHNQSEPDDLSPIILGKASSFYRSCFSKSKLQISSKTNTNFEYLPKRLQECGINFTALPNWNYKSDEILYPEYDYMIPRLKTALLSMPRFPLGPSGMTEKSWLAYAAKAWEAVRKSVLIMDYARLLQ